MADAAETPQPERGYYPGPIALAAHRSRAQVKLAWGPLGTAKTTWLCWRAKAICARAAKAGYTARIIYIRDTYRNLIDSTYATWKEWFPPDTAAGYVSHSDPIDFKLNVGDRYHDIEFRYGQTEQDASKFLSTEYDGIMLEEIAPAYIPGKKLISPGIAEGLFDMAISRLTRKADRAAAIRPELCMTCNPPPLNHWSSQRIIDKNADYLGKVNWAHFYFSVDDNRVNLRPDYYSNLELAWEGKRALIQRFLKGERLPVFIGIPRFNLDQLDRMKLSAEDPYFRGFLIDTNENILRMRLEGNPEGPVRIWTPPELGHSYIIGADSAQGVEGGDYSAAYVIDRQDANVVASYHHHIEPEAFGVELARLGYLYNYAGIAVETGPSEHGGTTNLQLKNVINYHRLYYHRNLDARSKRQERWGWPTDTKTKPLLVDGIGAYLDTKPNPDPYIPDVELIGELQTFGVGPNGDCEAQEGCFDDRVMSFGIALAVNKVWAISKYFPPKGTN